jgi:RND family efflux transporter MFP subunit
MHPIARSRLPVLHRCAACVGLVLVAMCSTSACKRAQQTDAGAKQPEPVLLGAEDLATATRVTLRSGPTISGTLEPEDKAVIRAETGGSVVELRAQLGDAVKRDDVLARIEVGGLGDAYRSAQVGVSAAERTLQFSRDEQQRSESLFRTGAQSRKQLDDDRNAVSGAQARLETARAQATTARKQLRDTSVRAPIAGVVSEQPVNRGDVVAPGAPLFTVIDPSSLRLEASVPSASLSDLARGTAVEFEVRGHPGKAFRGVITRIAPAADTATRQIAIQASIPNASAQLLAGLFAEGRIASREKHALALPLDAVDQRGPRPMVTVIRGGRAQRVEVALGLIDDVAQRVEIARGVAAGERVVVGAAADIEPNTPVRVEPGPKPSVSLDAGSDASLN